MEKLCFHNLVKERERMHFDLFVSCAHWCRKAAYLCAKSAVRYVREKETAIQVARRLVRKIRPAFLGENSVGSSVSDEAGVCIKLVSSTYFYAQIRALYFCTRVAECNPQMLLG